MITLFNCKPWPLINKSRIISKFLYFGHNLMYLLFANLLLTLIIGASINQNDEKGLNEARKITDACSKVIEITKNVGVWGSATQGPGTRGQFIALRDFLNSLEPIELFCQLKRLGKMEIIFIYSFLECPDEYFTYVRYIQNLTGKRTEEMIYLITLTELAMKKLDEYKESNSEMIDLYRDLEAERSRFFNLREFFTYFIYFFDSGCYGSRIGKLDLIKMQKEVQKAVNLKHPFLACNLFHGEQDILFWLIYNHSLSSDSEGPSSLDLLKERINMVMVKRYEIDSGLKMEIFGMVWTGIEKALINGGYPETEEINLTIRRIFCKLMYPLGFPI